MDKIAVSVQEGKGRRYTRDKTLEYGERNNFPKFWGKNKMNKQLLEFAVTGKSLFSGNGIAPHLC